MRCFARPHAVSALLAALGVPACSSPTVDPGDAFVGQYYTTEEVTILTDDRMPVLSIRNRAPVTILHGTNAHVVINDTQCLIPADATSDTRLVIRPNTFCERVGGEVAGLRVNLTFLEGTATLTGRNLTINARGSFESVAPDGGAPPPITRGSFTHIDSGARE